MALKVRIENKLPLIVTLFFAAFGIAKFYVQGPAWLHQNGDVNYVYLLSGLDYWSLLPSGINDQPALTVKLVNAIIIGVVYLFRMGFTANNLESDVIFNSELYLSAISLIVFAALVFIIYRFLTYTYKVYRNKEIWFIASVSFFSSYIVLVSLFVNKPEPYLLISGLGLGYLVIKRIIEKTELSVWSIIGIGLFAILSKVTFAPFLLILAVTIPSYRSLIKVLISGSVSSAIIIFIWWQEFRLMLDFLIKTGTHDGAYGAGSLGFYGKNLFDNFLNLLKINPILITILFAGLVYSIIKKTNQKEVYTLFISFILFFIFILKNPFSHYFLPCYAILPTYILVSFKDLDLRKYKSHILIICTIALIYRGGLFANYITNQHRIWTQYSAPEGIQNYYSSSKSFCLLGADVYQNYRHKDLLTQLYPNDTIYWFDNTIRNTNGIIPHSTLFGEHTITGSASNVESDSMLTILELIQENGIRSYKVTYRKD